MSIPSLALVLSLTACGVHHAPAPWVTDLRVEGSSPTGSGVLYDPDLPQLEGPDSAWAARETAWAARSEATRHEWVHWWQRIPLSAWLQPLPSLDPTILEEDRLRLTQWWVDHGWIDASTTLETQPSKRTCRSLNGQPCGQDVVFRVQPGPVVTVTARLQGIEPLAPKGLSTIDALLPPEGPAQHERLTFHQKAMTDRLFALGFGGAKVTWHLERTGLNEAVAVYQVEPGPRLNHGAVTVSAPLATPAQAVEDAISRAAPQGTLWNGDALERVGEAFAARPGISSITFEAGEVEAGEAPVLAELVLEPVHTFKPLYVAGAQGATLSAAAGFDWLHHGRVGRLVTSHVRALFGARAIPVDTLDRDWLQGNLGPTADVRASSDLPIFPSGRAVMQVSGHSVRDVRRGYQSLEHVLSAGVGWHTDRLRLNLSGVFDHRSYGHSLGQQPVHDAWFGADNPLDSRTQWMYPSSSWAFHTLDRDIDPTAGVRFEGSLDPWIPEEERIYRRATARIRSYHTLGSERWTLATHGAVGLSRSSDGEPIRGLGLRHFLGGPEDMRGFTWRNVSSPSTSRTAPREVRVGGDTLAFSSLTARYRIHPDFTVGPFVEAGRVWEVQIPGETPSVSDLLTDVGVECQATSPVGWVRGDVSWIPTPHAGVGTPPPRLMWQLTVGQRY